MIRSLSYPAKTESSSATFLQLVIANLLDKRKEWVIFVTKGSQEYIRLNKDQIASGVEIEEQIIQKLKTMHEEHIAAQ